MLRRQFIALGFVFAIGMPHLHAQISIAVGDLKADFKAHTSGSDLFSQRNSSSGDSPFQVSSEDLIPDYIRDNPMQYSYLCRLEKTIERNFQIPLWFKLEENNFRQTLLPQAGNAYIRMKMFRF